MCSEITNPGFQVVQVLAEDFRIFRDNSAKLRGIDTAVVEELNYRLDVSLEVQTHQVLGVVGTFFDFKKVHSEFAQLLHHCRFVGYRGEVHGGLHEGPNVRDIFDTLVQGLRQDWLETFEIVILEEIFAGNVPVTCNT